eukprot:XP_011661176.1 PREDICTED: uncharacterized protein LOC105436858 isoform X2 [Strongylocentrotus purpuratus]
MLIRTIYTRSCAMQQHLESKEYTKFHKFLKSVLRNIPNNYPRSYHLKEFGWNDFNKIGSIHSHCHVGNIQLASYQHWPSLDEGNDLSFFGRSLTLNFLPAYHDTDFVSRPVRYDSYITFLGRTAIYVGTDLRDAESEALYLSSLMQCIAVDVNKRTPVRIGSEIIKKYVDDKTTMKTPPQRHQFLPLQPGNGDVFRWTTTVQWSDVDYNRHVNQTPYLRFMYDAGSSAAVAGFLRSFHHELIHYKLKTYTVEYMQEIRLGKEVEVVCWEMDDNPGTIHFEVQVGDHTVTRSHLIFDVQPSAKL